MPPEPPHSPASSVRALRLAAAGAVGASVVHELRNALAVVSSSLYLARRDRADEARLVHHLDKAAAEVNRAQAVVGAVLGLARGEAMSRERTALSALTSAARAAVALPPGVAFSVAISPDDLAVTGDPVLLERVLVNLYLNAAEALADRPGGQVWTRASRRAPWVEIVVEDDGPGVDPSKLGVIFDPLVTTKSAGTGLGLSLVRAVAEAHGGSVEVGAREGGPGARFTLRIAD